MKNKTSPPCICGAYDHKNGACLSAPTASEHDIQTIIDLAAQNISEIDDLADHDEEKEKARRLAEELDNAAPLLLAAPEMLELLKASLGMTSETGWKEWEKATRKLIARAEARS